MSISPFFMYPGAQAKLIAVSHAIREARNNLRVRHQLERVIKKEHAWQVATDQAPVAPTQPSRCATPRRMEPA